MIPIYFINRGTYKEIIRTDKQYFICPYCKKEYRALAYHTRQKHGISAKRLRMSMGLKNNYQLTTPEIKERHREIAIQFNQPKKLIIVGRNTRFQNNHEGHTRKTWSNQAIHELKKRVTTR